jgi:hypothetical protein
MVQTPHAFRPRTERRIDCCFLGFGLCRIVVFRLADEEYGTPMSFLDLFEKDKAEAMRIQPNEGHDLPTYHEQYWLTRIGLVALAVTACVAAYHWRHWILDSLISVLTSLERGRRQIMQAREYLRQRINEQLRDDP